MKMNFEKVREVFIQNISIHNNLFNFSHRFYDLAATTSVVEAIFHGFQSTISAIKFKEFFWTNEIYFDKNERGFYL